VTNLSLSRQRHGPGGLVTVFAFGADGAGAGAIGPRTDGGLDSGQDLDLVRNACTLVLDDFSWD
jgi:hypothetical protein